MRESQIAPGTIRKSEATRPAMIHALSRRSTLRMGRPAFRGGARVRTGGPSTVGKESGPVGRREDERPVGCPRGSEDTDGLANRQPEPTGPARTPFLYVRPPRSRILRILREGGANVMPSRMACVAILLFWVYAAVELLRRDVLPDFWVTPPPDLRSIAAAEEDARPDPVGAFGRRGLRPQGVPAGRSRRDRIEADPRRRDRVDRPRLVRLGEPAQGDPVRRPAATSGSRSRTGWRSTPRGTSGGSGPWSARRRIRRSTC